MVVMVVDGVSIFVLVTIELKGDVVIVVVVVVVVLFFQLNPLSLPPPPTPLPPIKELRMMVLFLWKYL